MISRLIQNAPTGLRERRRADGTVRIWWEPSAAARKIGFTPVELDEKRLTWSRREAERLNTEVARASRDGKRTLPAASGRTVAALIATYQRSLAFTGLAAATQASYRANFRLLIDKWGPQQVRDFTKPVMRAWYETMHQMRGAHQAVALIRAMSLLFSHAELIGWRAEGTNPCQRLKLMTPPKRARAATWAEIDALIATADRIGLPSIGTAITLSLLQGQRQTDVRLARAGDFQIHVLRSQDGRRRVAVQWTFTRSKRGNSGALWLHDDAVPRILPLIRGHGDPARPILTDEKTGQPYDLYLFARRWREVRGAVIKADKSGAMRMLETLQFRDLRRTFGVMSRAGGASKDDTADVLGNSAATNPQLAGIYMPAQLDTASRAVRAIKRPPKM